MTRHLRFKWYITIMLFVLYMSASLWGIRELEKAMSPFLFHIEQVLP